MTTTKREKVVKQFGKRLRQAVDDSHYSVAAFCRESEIERVQAYRFFRGETAPSLPVLIRMGKVLGGDFNGLLG